MSEIRDIKEIMQVKNDMEEVLSYIRDPCMRAHIDSFLSAIRWVLKEKYDIFPGWSDKKDGGK